MPRNRKIISLVVFLHIVGLLYVSVRHVGILEELVAWLNVYKPEWGYLLDAARVFQMFALAICSIQLADFLSDRKPGKRYWLMLAPFPFAFLYFWAQVATSTTEVFPRFGIIGINIVIGAILLSYSAMLGFMRERCR